MRSCTPPYLDSVASLDLGEIISACEGLWDDAVVATGIVANQTGNGTASYVSWRDSQRQETGGSPWLVSTGGIALQDPGEPLPLAQAPDLAATRAPGVLLVSGMNFGPWNLSSPHAAGAGGLISMEAG